MDRENSRLQFGSLACAVFLLVLLLDFGGDLQLLTSIYRDASTLHTGNEPPAHAVRDRCQISLHHATATDIAGCLEAGILTSAALVRVYIERADDVNDQLHAISEINPDALRIAERLDEERAHGEIRGPLHGIPVLVKDNIATLDSLNTTAGSYALLGARVSREAPIVTALRNAGAIVFGKSTMGEWAQYRSTKATGSAGWSAYGQQPLGAWYPRQDPHGSSSGSAIAVSVGLAPLSLGTETSGSIVNPAERNNLVGIKPTVGLVSRDMVIPISPRQDSVGPIARTVRDAATVLSVIAGRDRRDNYTMAQPDHVPDYIGACDEFGLKGARIGIPRNLINYHLKLELMPVMDAFEHALREFVRGGASVTDAANLPKYDPSRFHRNEGIVLGSDFPTGIRHYFAGLAHNPHGIRSLEDLRNFTWEHGHEEWPSRDTRVWDLDIQKSISPDSATSFEAYRDNVQMATELGIDWVLDHYKLDALVMPTFAAFQLPAVAGLPVITVPLGFFPDGTDALRNQKGTIFAVAPGIPFGISFVGRKWSEATLIRLAYAFEQRTQVHASRLPLVLPKPDIVLQAMPQLSKSLLSGSHDKTLKHDTRFNESIVRQHVGEELLTSNGAAVEEAFDSEAGLVPRPVAKGRLRAQQMVMVIS